MDASIKEGDHYKTLCVGGTTFDLYYGFYDEIERYSPYNELIPIYPDFSVCPQFTKEGFPFVTQMQDACEHFYGDPHARECHACHHFRHGDELIGICTCKSKREIPTI